MVDDEDEVKEPFPGQLPLERKDTGDVIALIDKSEHDEKKRKHDAELGERTRLLNAKKSQRADVIKHRDAFASVLRDVPQGMSGERLAEWLMSRLQAETNRYDMRANELTTQIAFEEEYNADLRRRWTKEETAFNDRQFVRQMKNEQKSSGIRMSLEERNYEVLGRKGGYKPRGGYNCTVCMSDYEIKEILVLSCGHYWCISCMRHYFKAKIDDNQCMEIKCCDPSCKTVINYEEVRLCLEPEMFERYERFVLEAGLKKDPDCRWCPKPGCETAMFGDKSSPMMQCPSCDYKFCFNCDTDEWHDGASCEDFQRWKKENGQADVKYEEWKKQNTKECPQCHTPIQKNGGCDHMTCANCRYEFYWHNLAPYPGGRGGGGRGGHVRFS